MSHPLTRLAAVVAAVSMLFNAQAQERRIAVTAHRGFWKTAACKEAQNSVKALRLAQKNRFWGSEFDVHLTKDNIIVVNHNDDIEGVPIHTSPYAAFRNYRLKNGEKLPTLDDYLVQGKKSGNTVLVLEIKPAENDARSIQLTDMCIQKLLDHGLYDPSRVIFISFSLAACRHLAVIAPEFTNQYLNGGLSPDELHQLGINGLDYYFGVIEAHPEWVARAHELGMSVNVWTVNKEKDMRKMIALGVDCITTNEPLKVRELLGSQEHILE